MKVCVVLFVSVGTPLLILLALAQQVTVDFGSTAPTTQTTSSQKTQNSQQSTSAEAVPPSAKRLLTNADVVRMIKAGLAESTILLAIEQNPSKFDTAPAALIDLKEQGVPPAIVEAMKPALPVRWSTTPRLTVPSYLRKAPTTKDRQDGSD